MADIVEFCDARRLRCGVTNEVYSIGKNHETKKSFLAYTRPLCRTLIIFPVLPFSLIVLVLDVHFVVRGLFDRAATSITLLLILRLPPTGLIFCTRTLITIVSLDSGTLLTKEP